MYRRTERYKNILEQGLNDPRGVDGATTSILADMRRTAWNAESAVRRGGEDATMRDGTADGLPPLTSNGSLSLNLVDMSWPPGPNPSSNAVSSSTGTTSTTSQTAVSSSLDTLAESATEQLSASANYGEWAKDIFAWYEFPSLSVVQSPSNVDVDNGDPGDGVDEETQNLGTLVG